MKKYISAIIAFAIFVAAAIWMLTGTIVHGGRGDVEGQTIAEREAERQDGIFKVRATKVFSQPRISTLDLRGRTKSRDLNYARSKISGIVEESLVEKGDRVDIGDMLCRIDQTTISKRMEQAENQLAQAKKDYEAGLKLIEDGFSTDAQIRGLKTAYSAAVTSMTQTQEEMSRTVIKAEVKGIVQEPIAKVGDNLNAGAICATLLENDPILFTAQVSEQHVNELELDQEAQIKIISGDAFKGKITFIASIAEPNTRTFEVELTLDNPHGIIRDGMTATAKVPLKNIEAFELTSSWLVLADDGQIGVRTIDENNKVKFQATQIVAQDRQSVWVKGLSDGTGLIILGQNYVKDGETVQPVFE